MPRFARRGFTQRRRIRRKWCGAEGVFNIPNEAALAVADGDPFCPVSDDVIPTQQDITVERIIVHIGISRNAAAGGSLNPHVGVWIGLITIDNAGAFSNVRNAFTEDTLNSQDTMYAGLLGVPPILLVPSSDAAGLTQESIATKIDIKAKRIVNRNTHAIGMFVVQDTTTDNSLQYRFISRTLMRFT